MGTTCSNEEKEIPSQIMEMNLQSYIDKENCQDYIEKEDYLFAPIVFKYSWDMKI